MPAAAERLLGEKLRLPSVATWWCGEQPALDYVVANIEAWWSNPRTSNQNSTFSARKGSGGPKGGAAAASSARLVMRGPMAYVRAGAPGVSRRRRVEWRAGGAHGFAARAWGSGSTPSPRPPAIG